MTVIPFIHTKLLQLDFNMVCPYDFAKFLFEEYDQSMFEPLKIFVRKVHYNTIMKDFPNIEELLPLINDEFLEYMRQKVLEVNGFETEDGCHINKNNVIDIELYLQ
jgi:hypothetical protein